MMNTPVDCFSIFTSCSELEDEFEKFERNFLKPANNSFRHKWNHIQKGIQNEEKDSIGEAIQFIIKDVFKPYFAIKNEEVSQVEQFLNEQEFFDHMRITIYTSTMLAFYSALYLSQIHSYVAFRAVDDYLHYVSKAGDRSEPLETKTTLYRDQNFPELSFRDIAVKNNHNSNLTQHISKVKLRYINGIVDINDNFRDNELLAKPLPSKYYINSFLSEQTFFMIQNFKIDNQVPNQYYTNLNLERKSLSNKVKNILQNYFDMFSGLLYFRMNSRNLALGFLEVYRGELACGGIELINMIKFMAKNHRKIPVNYAIEAHKSLQVFSRFFGTESTELRFITDKNYDLSDIFKDNNTLCINIAKLLLAIVCNTNGNDLEKTCKLISDWIEYLYDREKLWSLVKTKSYPEFKLFGNQEEFMWVVLDQEYIVSKINEVTDIIKKFNEEQVKNLDQFIGNRYTQKWIQEISDQIQKVENPYLD